MLVLVLPGSIGCRRVIWCPLDAEQELRWDEAREAVLALGWCDPRREGSTETKPSKNLSS